MEQSMCTCLCMPEATCLMQSSTCRCWTQFNTHTAKLRCRPLPPCTPACTAHHPAAVAAGCCPEATASTPAELTSGMTEQQYSTKTRGQRTQPAARAAGEGQYMIAKGGSRGGAHLAYKLELPQQVGEAQKVLGIKEEGSFVIR